MKKRKLPTKKPKTPKLNFFKETDQYKVKMGDLCYAQRTVSLKSADSERAMKAAAIDYADAQNILRAIDEQIAKLRTQGEMYL